MEGTLTHIKPSVCFEVQKIIGVSMGTNGNLPNYHVQWAPTWVSGFHLTGCEHLIKEFLHQQPGPPAMTKKQQRPPLAGEPRALQKSSIQIGNKSVEVFPIPSGGINSSPDLPLTQQLKEAYNRPSGNRGEEHLFAHRNDEPSLLHRHSSPQNNEKVQVVSEETNMHNKAFGSNNGFRDMPKNPNFEWVQNRLEDENSDDDPLNSSLIIDTSANEEENGTSSDSQQTRFFVSNLSKNDSREDLIEVRDEEIVMIEQGECDQSFIPDHDQANPNQFSSSLDPLKRCDMCEKVFTNNSGLTRHYNKTHGVYICDICNARFDSKYVVLQHRLTHDADKQYKCNICYEPFADKNLYIFHMRTHSGQRTHACSFCEKTFFTSTKLKRHLRIHTGERPYVCEVCGKAFQRKDHLTKHVQTHRDRILITNAWMGDNAQPPPIRESVPHSMSDLNQVQRVMGDINTMQTFRSERNSVTESNSILKVQENMPSLNPLNTISDRDKLQESRDQLQESRDKLQESVFDANILQNTESHSSPLQIVKSESSQETVLDQNISLLNTPHQNIALNIPEPNSLQICKPPSPLQPIIYDKDTTLFPSHSTAPVPVPDTAPVPIPDTGPPLPPRITPDSNLLPKIMSGASAIPTMIPNMNLLPKVMSNTNKVLTTIKSDKDSPSQMQLPDNT